MITSPPNRITRRQSVRKALLLLTAVFAWSAAGQQLDSASNEALEKTQTLLHSKSERQKYIDKNPAAKSADQKIDALTGDSSVKEDMYGASSDIFADLVKQTGGDVNKLNELLEKAMKDPESFYNHLSPAQQQQIRDIAGKIQKTNPLASPRN